MLRLSTIGYVILVSLISGCASQIQPVTIHPNCPSIPATTFNAVGLDAKAGAMKFGEVVTIGELSVKSDPKIISGISKSVIDDQVTHSLICAARERGELKTREQIDHAWKVARFYRTNPTSDDAMEFYKQNPFPVDPAAFQNRKSPLKVGVSADTVRQRFFQFHEEGLALVRMLDTDTIKVSPESKLKVKAWISTAQTYIESNFADPIYAHRFKNFADLPSPKIPSADALGEEWMRFRAAVMYRIVRLDQYLDKID